MREALRVLNTAETRYGFSPQREECPVGGAGIEACGKALPDDTP